MSATGAVVARYSQGQNIDEPLAMSRSGATSYYEADGLGSVTSLTSGSGALAQTYTFDSFGKLMNSAGSLTNTFQYTAREYDAETGLYYYRARYYDPAVGRFLAEDQIRFTADVNFYDYVSNHATGAKDPSGHDPTGDVTALSIVISGYYLCADQVKREFNHFSREGHPRYAHCMASCSLVKRCGSKAAALMTGYAKETADLWDCLKTGKAASCNTAFQPSDLRDNSQGRNCPKGKTCEEQCSDLRDLPDAPPGPFDRRPFVRH